MGSISVIDNCPDGLDCPHYEHCCQFKTADEPCPLEDRHYDNDVPLDKIITGDYS
jgi:hypothetical protein